MPSLKTSFKNLLRLRKGGHAKKESQTLTTPSAVYYTAFDCSPSTPTTPETLFPPSPSLRSQKSFVHVQGSVSNGSIELIEEFEIYESLHDAFLDPEVLDVRRAARYGISTPKRDSPTLGYEFDTSARSYLPAIPDVSIDSGLSTTEMDIVISTGKCEIKVRVTPPQSPRKHKRDSILDELEDLAALVRAMPVPGSPPTRRVDALKACRDSLQCVPAPRCVEVASPVRVRPMSAEVVIPASSPIITVLAPESTVPYILDTEETAAGVHDIPTDINIEQQLKRVDAPAAPARTLKVVDLETIRLIGQGSSGRCFLVRDTVSRAKLALKIVKKEGRSERECESVLREQETLRAIAGSPWFSALEASWCDTLHFYLALAYHPTDLDAEIMRCDVIEPVRARFYTIEIIIALNELHSRGIVHRDIKASNILIDKEGHVVLADFGLSKDFKRIPTLPERLAQPYWPFLPDDVVTPTTPYRDPKELIFVSSARCGSVVEMAPEIYKGEPYSFGVDFWAVAVTLYIMVTGRPPWYARHNPREQKRLVLEEPLGFHYYDEVDEDTRDFLHKMLEKSPKERLRIGLDMESHSYFAGVDWVKMGKRDGPAPWIPGREDIFPEFHSGHIRFTPGTPYDESNDHIDPYPQFVYHSDRILSGAVIDTTLDDDDDDDEDVYETIDLNDDIIDNTSAPAQAPPMNKKTPFSRLLHPFFASSIDNIKASFSRSRSPSSVSYSSNSILSLPESASIQQPSTAASSPVINDTPSFDNAVDNNICKDVEQKYTIGCETVLTRQSLVVKIKAWMRGLRAPRARTVTDGTLDLTR